MKRILNILYVSLLCMGYWGCSADNSTENPRFFTTLETTEQAAITTYEGLTKYFTVTSNTSWTAKPMASWLHITPQGGNSGTVTVALTVDPSDQTQGSEIFFSSENSVVQFSFPVFQMTQNDLAVSPRPFRSSRKRGPD